MPRGAQVILNSMKLTISINHLLALLVPFLCRNFYYVIILFVNSCFNPELLTFYSGNNYMCIFVGIFISLMFLCTFKVCILNLKSNKFGTEFVQKEAREPWFSHVHADNLSSQHTVLKRMPSLQGLFLLHLLRISLPKVYLFLCPLFSFIALFCLCGDFLHMCEFQHFSCTLFSMYAGLWICYILPLLCRDTILLYVVYLWLLLWRDI